MRPRPIGSIRCLLDAMPGSKDPILCAEHQCEDRRIGNRHTGQAGRKNASRKLVSRPSRPVSLESCREQKGADHPERRNDLIDPEGKQKVLPHGGGYQAHMRDDDEHLQRDFDPVETTIRVIDPTFELICVTSPPTSRSTAVWTA